MISEEKLKRMKEKARESKLKSYQRHLEKQQDNIQFIRNKNLNLVRIGNRKINCLRWGTNETKQHIYKKLEVCIEIKNKGHHFITEAIFLNGSRCDIFDLDLGEIFEILQSEELQDARKKEGKYPSQLFINYIKA